jgi:hypothetical protein
MNFECMMRAKIKLKHGSAGSDSAHCGEGNSGEQVGGQTSNPTSE